MLEERFLFLLLLLRQPRLQVIYVTGRPVPERIIEYYLSLLPGVIPSHARARLHMVATQRRDGARAGGQGARAPAGPRRGPRA